MAHSRYEYFDFQSNVIDRELKCYEFYKRVINNILDLEMPSFELNVREILDSSKDLLITKDAKNYEELSCQCARLVQFAVHDTCLVMQRFCDFLKGNPEVMEVFVYKKRIQMCCLGDGLALEAIAISKVIDKALIQFGFDDDRTQISVKVACRDENWKRLFRRLVREINNELKKVSLQFEFCLTPFTDPFTKKLQEVLKKAHIVTMVNFLSSQSSSRKKPNIIKNTVENMRKNGILFYLDTENKNDYQTFSNIAEKCDPFSEVFFSPTSNEFNLQNEVFNVDDNSDFDELWKLVKNDFDPTVCSTWIKAFVKKVTQGGDETLKVVTKTSTGLSSNKIRNSTKKFKLVGKFSRMDMEKKNKDDSHRREAIKASTSRYASFDDDY